MDASTIVSFAFVLAVNYLLASKEPSPSNEAAEDNFRLRLRYIGLDTADLAQRRKGREAVRFIWRENDLLDLNGRYLVSITVFARKNQPVKTHKVLEVRDLSRSVFSAQLRRFVRLSVNLQTPELVLTTKRSL